MERESRNYEDFMPEKDPIKDNAAHSFLQYLTNEFTVNNEEEGAEIMLNVFPIWVEQNGFIDGDKLGPSPKQELRKCDAIAVRSLDLEYISSYASRTQGRYSREFPKLPPGSEAREDFKEQIKLLKIYWVSAAKAIRIIDERMGTVEAADRFVRRLPLKESGSI